MNIKGSQLKPNSKIGGGRVRRYILPYGKIRITQISTFCPDIVGPGVTHIYLIENDKLILMDTGMPTQLAKTMFHWRNAPVPSEIENLPSDYSEKQLFEGLKLAGHSFGDIDHLVISHGHLDHFSLGPSLLNHGMPKIVAHILDTPAICNPWGMLKSWISRRQRMLGSGMPSPRVSSESLVGSAFNGEVAFSLKVDTPVFKGGVARANGLETKGIQIEHLPGHSPGSIGLIVGYEGEESVLLCGDVLLNPITPHPDDLLSYLCTLEKLRGMDTVVLVLPAHGKAMIDLKARVAFMQQHHYRRLKLTYDVCKEPKCVWEIAAMPGYFDTYVDAAIFNPIAGMEVLEHMDILKMVDGLFCSQREGILYYQNSGERFDEVYARVMGLVRDKMAVAATG